MVRLDNHISVPNDKNSVMMFCNDVRGFIKGVFFVSEEDYPSVSAQRWFRNRDGYILNNNIGMLHRYLLNCPSDREVDHINRIPYDNRRQNLRVCTSLQNKLNRLTKISSSGVRGVVWDKKNKKWRSALSWGGRTIHLGRYEDKDEAATARLIAEQYRERCL